jgi:hypothetical protein
VRREDENRLARLERWQAAWPTALAHWSKYTRLQDPHLCETQASAAEAGLNGSFAMIRLADKQVMIDLETTRLLELDDYAVEILAHEIGHHILAPATAADQFRLIARIRRGLPTLERYAALLANLYTDLLINDRLQRQCGLQMALIYEKIQAKEVQNKQAANGLWALYMGIYESLWTRKTGSLGGPVNDAAREGDCWLGARIVRVYANDWLTGAGRFAALALPYLVDYSEKPSPVAYLLDTAAAAAGCEPVGVGDISDDEISAAIHPARDPLITGGDAPAPDAPVIAHTPAAGQMREPFDYGEILKAAGVTLSDQDIAARYYREHALPHLVQFPARLTSRSPEPQLEGIEPWEIGDAMDTIDWLQTLVQSPKIVPGLTTVRRTYGEEPGTERQRTPVDLDLYIDSSGSMPNPQQRVSYLALAGTIIALSALKAGASVQVTLWSGKHECTHTAGFVKNEKEILSVLTGFYGGATAFPIHKLRDTYEQRGRHRDVPVHILQISDDGISTMFDLDERGNSGWDVTENAIKCAGGGATMALNLSASYETTARANWMDRAIVTQGWDIHLVRDFSELTDFAHAFSARQYGGFTRGRRI